MMTDKALLDVAAQAVRITSTKGRSRRDGVNGWAYVPWRYLDGLADALRRAGIEPGAANLGASAVRRIEERKVAR